MRNKINIILKTSNRALISGSGLHRRGLLVDVRDYLKNVYHETIVNNPTYSKIISSKNNDTYSNLVDILFLFFFFIILLYNKKNEE